MAKRSNSPRLSLERLETRLTPAVTSITLAGGSLTVQCDGGNDMVQFSNTTIGGVNYVAVMYRVGNSNCFNSAFFNANQVTSITANANGGNDYLANLTNETTTLNGSNGGVDYLQGGTGNDVLNGGGGDDFIVDNAGGMNTFNGGAGNDILSSTLAGQTLNGGDGNDFLYDIIGGSTHNAGAGLDTVISTNADTRISVEADDLDVRFGQATTTVFYDATRQVLFVVGTAGNDTITIDPTVGNPNNITVNFNGSGIFSIARSAVRGIGVLGGDGNDVIDNNTDDNVSDGNNAIFMVAYGGNGNDDQRGSGGRDFLKGGGGNDFISARSGGSDIIGGDAGVDVLVADNGAGVASGRDFIYADPGETVTTDGNDVVGGQFLDNNGQLNVNWFTF